MPSIPRFHFLVATLVLFSLPISNSGQAQLQAPLSLNPTTNSISGDTPSPAPAAQPAESHFQYQDILELEKQGKYNAALAKANAAVQANPHDISPYILRGHIYSEMSQWDKADADFQTILQIDPNNFSAQFNRSEVKLTKKDYDGARLGFLALEKNPDWGDLAAYKVFVCDLFAGHQLDAQSEFNAFNKVGSHASYYYANATWSFYHKQPQEAQSWINSAERIYPRKIIYFYSATLVDNGYIPPPPTELQIP